jgi:hypothetical protein
MIELEQKTYFEITIQKIEELILEHFYIQLDLMEDMDFKNRSYFAVDNTSKDKDQILDKDAINYCLLGKEASVERLEQAIWCLIMKDVIPEGNYLVSIFW